ncbi:hypothetical protein BDF20DRAFT_889895 [Mycotypha africana]|uniref:uncharacterized protein n=1 Tax=Mycotypha africana TaxID=64632 RepID=UPI002301F5E7|nr:uncharacterized protein BDF20DRAFT_889895 [Mycotypha africana]KAI8970209.1 hypothetical protein BDF20DRAFT_889895 [Mycotypha africana]
MSKVESRIQLLTSLPKLNTGTIIPFYQQHHNNSEGNRKTAAVPYKTRARKSHDLTSYYADNRSSFATNSIINSFTAYTPPSSPNRKDRLRSSIKSTKSNQIQAKSRAATINTLATELTQMFEDVLQQYNAAETKCKKSDSEMILALNVQSNMYEQRINELHQQIEIMQSERTKRFSDDFITDLIHNYTDTHEDDKEDSQYDVLQIRQLLEANERTMQTLITQYVCSLEKERLENKTLRELIEKQDKLISILQKKLSDNSPSTANITRNDRRRGYQSIHNSEKLLKAQLELQGIELEDKKKLLSVLIDERDGLLKQVNELRTLSSAETIGIPKNRVNDEITLKDDQQRDSVNSIDILARIAQSSTPTLPESPTLRQTPTSLSLKSKYSYFVDQTAIPQSPPPISPLPPTPTSQQPQQPTFLLSKCHSQRVQSSCREHFETQYRNSMQEHRHPSSTSPLKVDNIPSSIQTSASVIKPNNPNTTTTTKPAHHNYGSLFKEEVVHSHNKNHRHSLTLSSIIKSFKRHP